MTGPGAPSCARGPQRVVATALTTLTALAVTACGVQAQSEPEPVPSERLPSTSPGLPPQGIADAAQHAAEQPRGTRGRSGDVHDR
jgi:hypothetical protein